MSLQAAFRKRLRKARRDPTGVYRPETTRVVGAPEKHTGDQPDRPGGGQPERRAGAYPPQARKVSQRPRAARGKFKKVPADNPYAGGHVNVQAAVMKAVRMVSKHKDKRGSTAHHGKDAARRYVPSGQGGDLDVQDPQAEGLPQQRGDPYVMSDWQAEERRHSEGQGRPNYGPDPIVIDPDETPAQRRARHQARDEEGV